jgi:pantoate--beta-alanine ligase
MGALHQGHINLIHQAQLENDAVFVSIFVNPTQFGPNEDFNKYPRTLEADVQLISELVERNGFSREDQFVFAPNSAAEMYGNQATTFVSVDSRIDKLDQFVEGGYRPGHFNGVCTVVAKLFGIVQPDRAYFGAKDGLQSIVLRKMTRDLNIPVDITIMDTIREKSDGLAMSSRNRYLSPQDRAQASSVPKSLFNVSEAYKNGERNISVLKKIVSDTLNENGYLRVQYVSVADGNTGLELPENMQLQDNQLVMVSLAAYCGTTRLIDNILLPAQSYPFRSLRI